MLCPSDAPCWTSPSGFLFVVTWAPVQQVISMGQLRDIERFRTFCLSKDSPNVPRVHELSDVRRSGILKLEKAPHTVGCPRVCRGSLGHVVEDSPLHPHAASVDLLMGGIASDVER